MVSVSVTALELSLECAKVRVQLTVAPTRSVDNTSGLVRLQENTRPEWVCLPTTVLLMQANRLVTGYCVFE